MRNQGKVFGTACVRVFRGKVIARRCAVGTVIRPQAVDGLFQGQGAGAEGVDGQGGVNGGSGALSAVWTIKDGELGERVQFRAGIGDGAFVEAAAAKGLSEGDLLAISYSEKPRVSLWRRIFQ